MQWVTEADIAASGGILTPVQNEDMMLGIPETIDQPTEASTSSAQDQAEVEKQKLDEIVGDVDFDNVKEKSKAITPVPGGVGPMTIACLLSNTVECFKKAQLIR